ncbi:MAG: leucyl aminopeptidase family protein [Pseudomonadota bacterium]
MDHLFQFPAPFVKNSKKKKIAVHFLNKATLKEWLKKQKASIKSQIKQTGFDASPHQICDVKNARNETNIILCGIHDPVHYLDSAYAVQFLETNYSKSFLNSRVFSISSKHEAEDLNKLCIGWGLAHYRFTPYKKSSAGSLSLITPEKADPKDITASIEAVSLLRNLINTPANDLGTNELASAAKTLAKNHKASIKIIQGKELENGFPMIHAVGKASPRPPQLVDLRWGKDGDPKVTIVGKGIIYDTGGLNLKPGQFMRDMKKDMGGAAHALGVAHMVMAMNLPIQLRVLLPIAENAVAGNSYRPGDVLQTRKGDTVEINDTDAEGRLVVADALTYACEEKNDLLIDFCTLTGAARVALGYDIPAFFSNQDEFLSSLRDVGMEADDPVWPLPLWQGYKPEMGSIIADISNEGTGRAGAIHGALFLEHFIDSKTDWIHFDCYAWEQGGKPGRPKGGADTGARALFHFLKERYL